jgi:hypothetical protein
VANTGYGYGDADVIGYSERLMLLFIQHLEEGHTVGDALRRAKAEYVNTAGLHSLSPYDEKILAEATLYGLPMMRVQMPGTTTAVDAGAQADAQAVYTDAPAPCLPNLVCRQVTMTPTYRTHAVAKPGASGTYLSVQGDGAPDDWGEIEVNEGQPIQPRMSLDISVPGTVASGAIFEGGRYQTIQDFDPVVTRVITDQARIQEPGYLLPGWMPASWDLINSVPTAEGLQQRLVVIPAQYRATTDRVGVERLFEEITYTVYYSTTQDIVPPSIWFVRSTRDAETVRLGVEVTDFSDVARVAMAHTTGDGLWQTVDLVRSADPRVWEGSLPLRAGLEYFVQAVDRGGNVAIHDNKGRYFGLPPYRIYMPLAAKGGSIE